jgi:hypothetical protein
MYPRLMIFRRSADAHPCRDPRPAAQTDQFRSPERWGSLRLAARTEVEILIARNRSATYQQFAIVLLPSPRWRRR